ncbi:hypothetical protein BGZ57DRAFT_448473 [Hyaloscypha finlandica]|nr:hypothetical protein BGZ57DRAFT_448473 [Hyaloscypha finlandica]
MEIDFPTTELLIRNDFATQPDNGGTTVFVISIIFAILSSVVVAGRLASRLSLGNSFGLDDVAIVVSLAVSIAQSIVICLRTTPTSPTKHTLRCIPRSDML